MTARIARLLAELPPDTAALACDWPNVYWLTGRSGEPHRLYGNARLWAVVGPGGDWRLVAPASELAWLAEQGDVDRVLVHGRFTFLGRPLPAPAGRHATPADALAAALDAVDAGEQVIVDDGPAPSELTGLAAASGLAPRGLTSDPRPFARARTVKDAAEIALLRRANAAAEAGILRALERAAPGVREHDLLRWVREAMLEHGARPLLGSVGIGEGGALVDFVPGDRRLARGDVVRFDVGCELDGYHADLARTAVLGPAPGWVADLHAALVAGEDAALAKLRPGATGGELFDAAVGAVGSAGVADYDRSHCGHGIGLEIYEPPLIAPGDATPLQPGMTLCVETPLYLIGQAGLQIEDAIVITDAGHERLGALPRELLEIGS